MDSVFRPSSGLVLALYIDGIRCSFESLSYSYGKNPDDNRQQVPMVMGRVAATHGKKQVEEYPTPIKDRLDSLAVDRTALYAQLNTTEQTKIKVPGPVEMSVKDTTLTLIKQNYPMQIAPSANKFPDPRGLGNAKAVGYNHELKIGETPPSPVTTVIADKYLTTDLTPIKKLLDDKIKVELTQGQVDALYSLILDIGIKAFNNSSLLTLINQSQFEAAAKAINLFTLHKGVVEPILTARRLNEFNSFGVVPIDVAIPTDTIVADNLVLATQQAQAAKKEALQNNDKDFIAIKQKIADIEKTIAELKATPKQITVKPLTWRNVEPNTKVHVLFMDNNWGPNPRFVGYYEGELTSPGFHKGAESRDFQFQSSHITECLDALVIAALEPNSFIKDTVTAATLKDGIPAELVSSGTIIEDFSPKKLAPLNGIAEEDMDVYNFAKYSLASFIDKITNSPVRKNYYARAAIFHNIEGRMYDPNYDPATFTLNGSKTKLKWAKLYTFIMTYVFMNLIPRLGNRISYMQMVNTVMELFLHEILINPAPTRSDSTVLVKPINVFTPVPICNIIFPIHGGEINHMESYRSKPTRLVNTANPPNGLPGDGALQRYYTNIAPKNLSDTYGAYLAESDPVKKAEYSLITKEEEKRGIIGSWNDLPGYLTALLQLITITDSTGAVAEDVNKVLGAGPGFSSGENTSTSMSGSLADQLSPEDRRAAEATLYFHKELMKLEDDTIKSTEDLSNDKLLNPKPAFTSDFKYVPNRITIVPFDIMPAIANKGNYVIINGKVTRKLGRNFKLFQEPTGSIGMLFKINEERGVLDTENKQTVFLIGDNTSEEAQLDPKYKKIGGTQEETLKHLKDMQSYVAGGYHQSVVISVDNHPDSTPALAKLLAIICEMCGIKLETKENTGNVRTLSDLFGSEVMAATNERDQIIKKVIVEAQDVRANMIKDSQAIIEKAVKDSTPTTVSSEGYDKRIFTALYINEGAVKEPGKISHAIAQNSNYTFGRSQFDIGQRADAWITAGFSQTEVNQLKAIGDRVRAAKSRNVETAEEITFIAGLESRLKANPSVIDKLDNAQSIALVKNAERQLKEIFAPAGAIFDSPSIFTHLVDISNQYGNHGIDNDPNAVKTMMLGFINEKLIKASGVLRWRGGSADQQRRQDVIEKLYTQDGGKSLTVEQLITSAHSGDTTTLEVGSISDVSNSAGTNAGGVGNSNTTLAITGGVSDVNTTVYPPNVNAVNIKEIWKHYSQPLCEYYFYYNRYRNNRDTMNIVFNPYAVAGYSTLLMDSSELQINLYAHIDTVTHNASADGRISTSLGISFIRRADDLGMERDLLLTAGNVDTGEGPKSVAESLKDDVPFFGGEYTEGNIDETFRKTIGCERLVDTELTTENLNSNDIVAVYETTRRLMQYCKITNVGDPVLQAEYDSLYKANPSRIAFKWNGGDFPDRISIVKNPQNVVAINDYDSLFRPGDDGYELIQDDKLFSPDVQAIVQNHTAITMAIRAQQG